MTSIPQILAAAMSISLALPISDALAACTYSPYAFFPERNDRVRIPVQTDVESYCENSFREGPGYHFTSVKIAKLPVHGIIVNLGENRFAYRPFPDYHGADEYVVRACAVVGKKRGCSELTYQIVVR